MRAAAARVFETTAVGVVALAVYLVAPLDGRLGEVVTAVVILAAAVLMLPLAVRRARQVLVADQPVLVATQALFTMIVVLIVSFASVYYMLAFQSGGQMDGLETKIDGLYFTVTVLATVGFGDITAVGQGARAVVTFQMIVNVVFVAVAIRVIAWALQQRRDVLAARAGVG